MPRHWAVRMMRNVISPRLAIRILLNGGCCFSAAAVDDENGRLLDDATAMSIAWGRARCSCCADDEKSHLDAVEGLMMRAAPPPLQAARRNNSLEEEYIMQVNQCEVFTLFEK